MSRPPLLALEFLLLFGAVPVAFARGLVPLPLFPALWLLAAGCLIFLLRSRDFPRRRLWNTEHLAGRAARAAIPFLLAAPLLWLATWAWAPERLFAFVRTRPALWAAVMVLYPVLSVYPQGLVYRAFLFHRYRALLPRPWMRILASAAAFSAVHLVFQNWVAPPLSFAGGLLFAWTYERTGSSLVTAIQHALFGCFLFTVGLGWFFYAGATR